MAKAEHSERKGNAKDDAASGGVHSPVTRLNIALPFSQIRTSEPSKELKEVVDLVADLLVALEGTDLLPPAQLEELHKRVEALQARLD